MLIAPLNQIPPDRERRAEIISKAGSEDLEKVRQHALATMHALSQAKGTFSPDYSTWSVFVGEIEAEQRRRELPSDPLF